MKLYIFAKRWKQTAWVPIYYSIKVSGDLKIATAFNWLISQAVLHLLLSIKQD
jgi:hypothetical protein